MSLELTVALAALIVTAISIIVPALISRSQTRLEVNKIKMNVFEDYLGGALEVHRRLMLKKAVSIQPLDVEALYYSFLEKTYKTCVYLPLAEEKYIFDLAECSHCWLCLFSRHIKEVATTASLGYEDANGEEAQSKKSLQEASFFLDVAFKVSSLTIQLDYLKMTGNKFQIFAVKKIREKLHTHCSKYLKEAEGEKNQMLSSDPEITAPRPTI